MSKKISLLCLIFASVIIEISLAQSPKKSTIGLVLSGGGAKGLAHIGVLKVLEEEGIIPDYIAGTSMGSIIGGLYAAGYSAHELDSIVNHVDWGRLLSDELPLTSISPHEKEDYNRYQAEFTITSKGLEIPSGLIKGQQISALFSRLTWHIADIKDFDNLPIPFRCVAADLNSGQEYVFKSGNLATAMRASMSIPTVFSPVKIDTLFLVDGGILNNFPVRLCRQMGADIIIGVNVGFQDGPEDKLKSFPEILMASATIAGNVSTRRAIRHTDLLISPDLKNFNTGSFFDAQKIIELGEQAAREKIYQIRQLADSINNGKSSPVVNKNKNRQIKISQITINGLQNTNRQFLLGHLGIQPGDSITPKLLDEGLKKSMGTRYFENITYDLIPTDSSDYILSLNIEESPKGKAKFSLHFDNENKAGLLSNLTLRNIMGKASRTSLNVDISESPRISFSQINFMGERQITAIKFGGEFESNKLPVYVDNGSKYGTFKHSFASARFGFMTALGTRWQMDAYLRLYKSTLQSKTGFFDIFQAGVERFGNQFLSSNFDFIYSSIDRRFFPVKGSEIKISYKFNLDAQQLYKGSPAGESMIAPVTDCPYQNFFTVNGTLKKYIPITNKFTAGLRASGQIISRPQPLLGLTFIGGMPFNNRNNEIYFMGYSFREIIAEDFTLGEINLRYNCTKQIHFSAIGGFLMTDSNLPQVIEHIDFNQTDKIFGYGLIMAYNSFLGPLQLGVGSNNSDNRLRWYFNFGFNF
ncbi:patatin-like phospholipase family protein [Thermophagus xiamenensis]|uniref:NTE family protein n=1 Tax=Thermophagus xiamenensis TaxID=385682 RepID=A0A1I1UYW5_9BACT|nr:patatin-like phospholipase family protein [Thermophagus xiamenensis]SFD73210.1 NTE family protein [Thermophagus xiamenensis]